MKKFFLVFLVSATTWCGWNHAGAAILYPAIIEPIRTEITNDIAFLTEGSTGGSSFQLRSLRQARLAIDRRGASPTLMNDVQVLSVISILLSRGDLGVTYRPLLTQAVSDYADLLDEQAASIAAKLNALEPTAQTATAQQTLDLATTAIERARIETYPSTGAGYLSRAAVRLRALDALVTRIQRNRNTGTGGGATVSATINGESFQATRATATYNPGLGSLTISASQGSGFETRQITLSLLNIFPGTSSVSLGRPGFDSSATYTRSGSTNVSYTSVSGSAVVTVNTSAMTANGTFSFVGSSRFGFDPPVQVSGGTFSVPLR